MRAEGGSGVALSHLAPVMEAELAVPESRPLPTLGAAPVSPEIPALPATSVRLATVAARYIWNLVLVRPK